MTLFDNGRVSFGAAILGDFFDVSVRVLADEGSEALVVTQVQLLDPVQLLRLLVLDRLGGCQLQRHVHQLILQLRYLHFFLVLQARQPPAEPLYLLVFGGE
eukprot:CAMPEP_0172537582 /NCGR_PEP_ID=MMETSP1067-20121228/9162_1 /TAXON_ID=265564 ORGANISM="Thalassiosira punctigera, Strain Tpunct2005C2" /NCGR_SAMPLE_ID=MMETSP1067 /ASSEMBLY_ACC=CAM_ASM_000444 /LENGTH=100 /DNA_ID=CAMNT_0013322917 /DNA_START=177 /DNA_END=477 /DNA_ORIENTATION=+